MERIKIITTDIPSDMSIGDGYIVINTVNSDPVLQYSQINARPNGELRLDWITIDGTDSPNRAVQISDLEFHLRSRDWNITERLFTSNGDLYLYTSPDKIDPIPQIVYNTSDRVKISENVISTEEEEFNESYELLMNLKPIMDINGTQVDFGNAHYYNLISSRDLVNNTSVIDLVSLGGSDYTNILNLNGLLEKIGSKYVRNTCILRLGVQYTMGDGVYSEDITFEPYSITESGLLRSTDFSRDISGNITLEYLDRCIRLFPKKSEVSECIISYCYFVYYGLE